MLITVSEEGPLRVTVLALHGDLDAASYPQVVDKAQEAYAAGARRLVLDLTKVPFISSAGLMALHTTGLLFSGHLVQKDAGGRLSYRSIDPEMDQEARQRVKLVSPQLRVAHVLETVGLHQFFEIHPDVAAAVGSF
jgi:anti-anti-sigma regulatory factor